MEFFEKNLRVKIKAILLWKKVDVLVKKLQVVEKDVLRKAFRFC